MHSAVQLYKAALCLDLLIQLFMRKYNDTQRWRDYSRNYYAFINRFIFIIFALVVRSPATFTLTLRTVITTSVIPHASWMIWRHTHSRNDPQKLVKFLTTHSEHSHPHATKVAVHYTHACAHMLYRNFLSDSTVLLNRLKMVLNKSHSAALICKRI